MMQPPVLSSADRPRPPAPLPPDRPLGTWRFMQTLRSNPIEGFTQAHFEQPLVVTKTILGGPVVVVSSPAGLRHVLIDNAANYPRERIQRGMLEAGMGVGLLAAEGEQWRQQRRVVGAYFSPRIVADLDCAMAEGAGLLVARWARLEERSHIDVPSELQLAVIDVLERTVFLDGIGSQRDAYPHALSRYFDTLCKFGPLDALNMPHWVPRISRYRARRSIALFSATADAVIEMRRARLAREVSSSPPNDLVTALLTIRDPKTGNALTAQEVKDNIITFISAGYETTANALTWSLYLLSLDREWRARLEAEADRELPDGGYIGDSFERLIETRAVIEEALRLYPPVPVTARQAVARDCIDGHDIAPGAIVLIAPWVIHRHRSLWQAPDEFDPARFLGTRASIDRFAYLPFGTGPRTCIGAAFALQEMAIILALIVRHFRLELAPGCAVWPANRVTLRIQNGLRMILHRRLG